MVQVAEQPHNLPPESPGPAQPKQPGGANCPQLLPTSSLQGHGPITPELEALVQGSRLIRATDFGNYYRAVGGCQH